MRSMVEGRCHRRCASRGCPSTTPLCGAVPLPETSSGKNLRFTIGLRSPSAHAGVHVRSPSPIRTPSSAACIAARRNRSISARAGGTGSSGSAATLAS